MSCIYNCMQAEGHSELSTLIHALKSKWLAKRNVVHQTQLTKAPCLSVYLITASYIFYRCTRFCVAKAKAGWVKLLVLVRQKPYH